MLLFFSMPYDSSNLYQPHSILEVSSAPTPLTPCVNSADDCNGIYDALGMCVCGSEIRTVAFAGTFTDSNCTDLVERLPRPKLPLNACFHLQTYFWKSLFAPKLFGLKVSCIKDKTGANIGANFKLWEGKGCISDNFVAEADVFPGQCVKGDLESFIRGKDIWVLDDTCTVD